MSNGGQLKRSLNLPQLVFYGVGTMVGAGIYSVIGAAFAEAGAQLWLSFIFAGVSTGLNVLAAVQFAAELGPGHRVATVAVDTGLKYLAGDLFT